MITHGKQIISESYYDGEIIATHTEIETSQFTDKAYLLKDVIDCLGTINKGQTSKLTIEITVDKKNRMKLTSRYMI